MELSAAVALVILAILMALGFLCALAESALFSLGRWQLQQLAASGGRSAQAARLLERPTDVLSTLSLANTVANGMVVVTSLSLTASLGWSRWTMLGVAFLAVLVVGEILPKTLAVRSPEVWAARVAPAVALLAWLTGPLRQVAHWTLDVVLNRLMPTPAPTPPMTDEEYRELLEVAAQHGALGTSEKEILAELITLDRRQVRDVMRPRATMAAVSDDLTTEELIEAARRFRHRRLPVYDETPDTIVGVLNTQAFLLDPEHRLEDALEFPSFVPETMNLLQLFQALQRQKRSLAIAMDEFGAVAGVVRMEDILAEVLGDMSSEGPARGMVFEKEDQGRWRVSGSVRLEDFRREYPGLPPVPDVETLGGLLMAQLDRVPREGEGATVYGLRLTVVRADERRVKELVVERAVSR